MTQLYFDELPIGAQIGVATTDRGVISALAVPAAPGGQVTALGAFNTISIGALGSGRLADVSLAALNSLATGGLAYVKSVKAFFRWDPLSIDINDNITIVTPIAVGVGAGRFYRILVPSLEWQQWVLGITIDNGNANASDENDGNIARPLKTFAEYRRRVGNGPLQANQTITIGPTDLATTDVLDLANLDTANFSLTIQGQPTVSVAAQQISAYTPRVAATNTPNQLTSVAATVWSGFVGAGFLVHMTSGAATGLYATVAKDLGANKARMGTFLNGNSVETQPVANDTYEIVALPKVTNYKLGRAAGIVHSLLSFVTNQTRLFGGTTSALNAQFAQGQQFLYCAFTECVLVEGAPAFTGCHFMAAAKGGNFTVFLGGEARFNGSTFFDPANAAYIFDSSVANWNTGCLLQGTSIAQSGGNMIFTNLGAFDTVTTAINGRRFAAVRTQTVWGDTGAGNPFACTIDRTSHVSLNGAGQTLTNGGGNEIAMPITASTTWAAVRAASGIKDGATSDASAMVIP